MIAYDIAIVDFIEDKLEIEYEAELLKKIKMLSKKAFAKKFYGTTTSGIKKEHNKALNIYAGNISYDKDGIFIKVETKQFKEFIELNPPNLFKEKSPLLEKTPMIITIEIINETIKAPENVEYDILKLVSEFDKLFLSENQKLILSNRGSVPKVSIVKKDIKKVKKVLQETLPPQLVIISGKVEELSQPKYYITIKTEKDNKLVKVKVPNDVPLTRYKEYFGKKVTIKGTAYYKGKSILDYILLEDIRPYEKGDDYFSIKPGVISVEDAIKEQLKQGKKLNPLNEIFGKWPGDETDEEIKKVLDKID